MINTAQAKPFLIFGSRHGSIYNLTPANLPQLSAIQLSFGDFFDKKDVIKSLPQGLSFKKFLGFNQSIKTYLSPYDFYKEQPITGCQDTKKVKIKCSNGYNTITAEQYDQVADIIKPDILVTLTEYPSLSKEHKKQSNKSYKRAINKTTSYLQQSKMTKNQDMLRLAAVHGSKNESLLSRSIQQILQHDVDGLIVCDLCEEQTLEERESVYNQIAERLKQENKKFILGLAGKGKLQDIEHARKFGYTYFEVNYPFIVAQKKMALVKQGDSFIQKSPVKNQNLDPLDNNCKCQTCTRHSQSYIAHLIECHQMTAAVLLTIHNMHIYTDYMKQFE